MDLPLRIRHQIMIGLVVPRPIAWVTTRGVQSETVNLAPFSFFMAFSSNPPIIGIAPAYRGRDGTTKDTLRNIRETGEWVTHLVPETLGWACALTSLSYPQDVSEVEKAGLTLIPSDVVQVPRVAESPVHLECRSRGILQLSFGRAGGNLVFGEVVRIHVREDLLDEEGIPDIHKIRFLYRLNRTWYGVTGREGYRSYPAKETELGIGVDRLPAPIRQSPYLTHDDLCNLAMVTQLPDPDPNVEKRYPEIQALTANPDPVGALHRYARDLLRWGQREKAWQILLYSMRLQSQSERA